MQRQRHRQNCFHFDHGVTADRLVGSEAAVRLGIGSRPGGGTTATKSFFS